MNREKLLKALPAIERYASTVLAVVCTLGLRLVLDPVLGDRAPFMFFILPIWVAKRLWGRGPGLLATLLGGISVWYFILEPGFSFAVKNRADAFNLAGYFVIGVGISFLGQVTTRPPASLAEDGKSSKFRVVRQTAVLAAAVLILAGMGLLLLRDFRRTQDAEGWVIHTYQVINSAESLRSLMVDAEAGQRDFLMTGDERFLAPYNSAVAALPRNLDELKGLTSDNPAQQARWNQINGIVDMRLAMLERGIEMRKASEVEQVNAALRSGQAEQSMNKLRSTLDAVMREERRLLVGRRAETELRASRGRWVLGLGSTVLIILLVFASVVIERETVRREEIAQALRRHADLLEQAHDSLFTWPLGGAIDYWSRGAETLYGYSREEAVGRSSHEFLQTSHPLGMAQVDFMLEREGQWKGELTQSTKDGRKLIVEGLWKLAVDAKGNKTVLEANRDITEHKRAEAENLLLATAIEQAAESVVITDRDAKIQYANPAFTRTTGYTHVEALGQNPRLLKSGQHDAQFYQELWATLAAGKLWRGEFTNRRKDGTLYMEEATVAPVRDASGEITNYIAIKSDITERKRGEEEVRLLNVELEQRVRARTEELETANRELEAFAHSVSHDLRAPLRGIDGWSLALLEDCGEHLDAQGQKYLERVRSEAQRMGRLIDDLLHLSRVSRAELVPSTIDLTALAETIIARLKEAHPGRCIEFVVAPQLQCTGDARLLEIALTNLLDNAVKFTGPRAAARIEFGTTECEGNPAFFVGDNGVGFDMAHAGMLFGPFQRLHKASEFPGTGIGLATVQRVIHRHGGHIWAEAQAGAGAKLYFTLGAGKR
ncbi:MAG: PAS domain S-box protein [Terriglobia bacterium]